MLIRRFHVQWQRRSTECLLESVGGNVVVNVSSQLRHVHAELVLVEQKVQRATVFWILQVVQLNCCFLSHEVHEIAVRLLLLLLRLRTANRRAIGAAVAAGTTIAAVVRSRSVRR